jgi:hypothetical protein
MTDDLGFGTYRVHNGNVIDLRRMPISMVQLYGILSAIGLGQDVLVRNGAHESYTEVMHRFELAYIAAHEARVRTVRDRERNGL